MLAVIFLLAVFTLWLAIALPKVRQEIQRDREQEAMHRGKQYRRAIQLYYRKFHVYPPSLDALKNTDGIRFLRKDYIDPITGKSDWQPILFGQNKVPTAMGFFGQPLRGTSIAGTGPGGAGLGLSGGSGSASGFGTDSSPAGSDAPGGAVFGSPSTAGSGSSGAGMSFGANGNAGTGDTSSDSAATNAPTFGGQGVIGVTIPSEKQALLVYKGQDKYNAWEFAYDPLQEGAAGIPGAGNGNGLGGASGLNGGAGTVGGLPGSGMPSNFPWSPNGNLPSAPGGSGQNGNGTQPGYPWSPNGNLPSAPQQ